MQQSFQQKNFSRTTSVDCLATESLGFGTNVWPYDKTVIASNHKISALCNIKGELVGSFSLNIARIQYFVVLMQ